jgi:hypothetical protein
LSEAGLKLRSSYFCLLGSWDDRHEPRRIVLQSSGLLSLVLPPSSLEVLG